MSMTDDDIAKARSIIARAGAPTWVMPSWCQALDGWTTALDEVERLRDLADAAERATEIYDDHTATLLEQANAASSVVAADWAEMKALRTRVADLEKLHSLAEQAMRSANEASKGFEAMAKRYFDAKEPLEIIADAARAWLAASDGDELIIATEALKEALK